MYVFRDHHNDASTPGPPERGSGKNIERFHLYNCGVFDYPLDDLFARWLEELAAQGLSSGWQKQAKGLGRPVSSLGERAAKLENGETIWVCTDLLSQGQATVLDVPLRTDQAILAAVTIAETPEHATKALDKALTKVADEMRRGESFETLPWQENSVDAQEQGEARPRSEKAGRSALPGPITEYRKALKFAHMLASRQPGFDRRSGEDQCRILAHACRYMTKLHEASRLLASFIEYGGPEGDVRPKIENPNRDVRAALLMHFEGYSEAEVGDRLDIERPASDRDRGRVGNSTARRAIKRGEKILRQVLSEEEWRNKILAGGEAAREAR